MENTLMTIILLPNGKNIKKRNWKIRLSPQSEKIWSNFLYFSTYLTLFPQSGKHFIVAIYFYEMQKKFSNFLYFFIHISFHFHEVENISPTHCIYVKFLVLPHSIIYYNTKFLQEQTYK